VHAAAMAYQKNKGIKNNAKRHVKNPYLLKMDFKDFFPSIRPNDLTRHIEEKRKIKLLDQDSTVIKRLFFYCHTRGLEHALSIGSPASPAISNTLLYNFDQTITSKCEQLGIIYTRYADDITFSTKQKGALFPIPELIKSILKEMQSPKITINVKKTVFASKKTNRHVTGLVLSSDGKISIGRDNKRRIKSLVFKFIKGKLEPDEVSYLRGYLAYCIDVEPSFIKSLENKYGEHIYTEIKNY
jgi:RNA-directed DNA polymerase